MNKTYHHSKRPTFTKDFGLTPFGVKSELFAYSNDQGAFPRFNTRQHSFLQWYDAYRVLSDGYQTDTIAIEAIPGITGADKYICSLVGVGGYTAYAIPLNATNVGKIDIQNRSFTSIGSSLGGGLLKYQGATLLDHWGIAVPRNATNILKINTLTDEVTTFGSVSGGWIGACVAFGRDGMKYVFAPSFNTTAHLMVDPYKETATTFGSGSGYSGICYHEKTRLLYCSPNSAGNVLVIDPITLSQRTIGTVSNAYSSLKVAVNGIMFAVGSSGNILKVDPFNEKVSELAILPTTSWCPIVHGPDGFMYTMNTDDVLVVSIDPKRDAALTVCDYSYSAGSFSWVSSFLAADGCQYFVPYNQSTLIRFGTPKSISEDFVLNIHVNHS